MSLTDTSDLWDTDTGLWTEDAAWVIQEAQGEASQHVTVDAERVPTVHDVYITMRILEALHEVGFMGAIIDESTLELGTAWALTASQELAADGVGEAALNNYAVELHSMIAPRLPDGPLGVPALLYMCLPFTAAENDDGFIHPPPTGLVDPDELRDRALIALAPARPALVRPAALEPAAAAATVAALEPAVAALSAAEHDGALDPDHGDYVRSTLAQIALWRDRPGADPRIFELLIKDLIKYLLPQIADPAGLSRGFEDLGASPDDAAALGQEVADAINAMARLGDEDPEADGEVLVQIADAVDRTAAGIERLATGGEPESEKLRTALAKGAAGELGKRAADGALVATGGVLVAWWPKIQLALLSGWHRIVELWR